MGVEIIVLCDARAYDCACARNAGHTGPHECTCHGRWSGAVQTGTFVLVNLPGLPARTDDIADELKAGLR